jgi:hypothetical protein
MAKTFCERNVEQRWLRPQEPGITEWMGLWELPRGCL